MLGNDMSLVECVPNISEGRDSEIISKITSAVTNSGANVLHVDSSVEANRTVITFAGEIECVAAGAFSLVKKASELIDMQQHSGVHPRMGAVDVCPFVPLSGTSLETCVKMAETLGARVAEELKIPVYLYESAAKEEKRWNLANVRRGEYEGLATKLNDPDWQPDFGVGLRNDKFGALITGARDFLIAYNVNISGGDVGAAKKIAARIREKGNKRRLKGVKAIGWQVGEQVQVAMNLVDFRTTGLFEVYKACQEEAADFDLEVTGSELIGLIPEAALTHEPEELGLVGFKEEERVVEALLTRIKSQ